MRSRALALVPTAILAILTFWSGSFHGAAGAWGSLVSQALVVLAGLLIVRGIADPLALGTGWRWLPWALVVLVWVSWSRSPVPRAGLLPAVLLPAYLLLPAAFAACWSSRNRLRLGMNSLSVLYLAVGWTALVARQLHALPRASLPLGHHNLLAAWLVLLLPLVMANLRHVGLDRWLATAATMTGGITLLATGSFLGALSLTLELALLAWLWRPVRRWLLLAAAIVLVLAAPRLQSIMQRVDPSSLARFGYLQAGVQGLVTRPLFGWGPGATPWTIAEVMHPIEGVHPSSEIVGDLHCLPLQIGYEAGLLGLAAALAIAVVFLRRRWRESTRRKEPTTARFALVGIAGGLLFGLGAAPLSVPALPATMALLVGITLVTASRAMQPSSRRPQLVYVSVVALVLAPAYGAHRLYDRARQEPTATVAVDLLQRAQHLDPGFPLYPARRALLIDPSTRAGHAQAAQLALSAAEATVGSAPLWLAAGSLGLDTGAAWAPRALERALDLDPLSPIASFLLLETGTTETDAIELAIKSLRGDPRLARALWWNDHAKLAATVSEITGLKVGEALHDDTRPMVLALTLDTSPATAFSLYAFRRLPWPATLATIEVRSR